MTANLPKILLFGRFGQVAWELQPLLSLLGTLKVVGSSECSFLDAEKIKLSLAAWKPDIIVNAAAYTAVDRAEEEYDQAAAINASAVACIADFAKNSGSLVVHYSTDYVFDGTNRHHPYTEEAPCHPLGAYGRTKREGEVFLAESGAKHLIFRTAWVYSNIGHNFLKTMLRLSQERESLRVVSDQIGTPTHARTIAMGTALAIRQWWAASPGVREELQGLYHLTASEPCSWYDFASAIINEARAELERKGEINRVRCKNIEAIPTSEYPTPAARPMYSVLNNRKFQQTFAAELGDWRPMMATAVREFLG